MTTLPTGTVTFLFSDVEGSTRRLERDPAEADRALAYHHIVFDEAVAANRGAIFETVGDAVYAAFERATDATATALVVHETLAGHDWADAEPLRVRIAIHTGQVESRGLHYFGPPLFRCSRIQALAWGGQTLLSSVAASLVVSSLPAGGELVDRGTQPLKDLDEPERVFELVTSSTPAFPPLRSTVHRPTNLPEQLSSLIGRESEVASLESLLRERRLVTVTGPAGTGKTRLSLEVARRLLDEQDDGVWFVDLAPVRDPELVPAAIAATLGVAERPPASVADTLADHLRSRRLLLVLDNFEQVAEAAPSVTRLLSSPDVRIIATSREALRVRDEREYPLAPLATGGSSDGGSADVDEPPPGVRLFIARAREALPSFEPDAATRTTIARITERLDGLPLAIELAAALVRVLSPDQILDRLDRRLDLLASRNRDLPERQRSLRAALTWSYDLLPDREARAFEGLAVFADGFTLAAAEAVLDDLDVDVIDAIGALLDKALLVRAFDIGAEARFRMLDTVRAFGLERLEARADSDRRHAALARWATSILTRDGQPIRWQDAIGDVTYPTERENVLAAIRWLDSHQDDEASVELVSAASSHWMAGNLLTEGRPWLLRAVARAGSPSVWTGRLLRNASAVESELGDLPGGIELIQRSIAVWQVLGADADRADALRRLGAMRLDQGQMEEGRRVLAEAEALAREAGDTQTVKACLADLGVVALDKDDLEEATRLFRTLLTTCLEEGDQYGVGLARGNLAFTLSLSGQVDDAEAQAREAVSVFEEYGKPDTLSWAKSNLAGVLAAQGRLDEAEDLARFALGLTWSSGIVRDLAGCIDTMMRIVVKRGDDSRALRLASAARRIRSEAGLVTGRADARVIAEALSLARDRLGPDFDTVAAAADAIPVATIIEQEIAGRTPAR